jgi:hypothetical protein
MSDTDHIDDEVLRRRLATKPTPHKPLREGRPVKRRRDKKATN